LRDRLLIARSQPTKLKLSINLETAKALRPSPFQARQRAKMSGLASRVPDACARVFAAIFPVEKLLHLSVTAQPTVAAA
jgi:hypothetical protein